MKRINLAKYGFKRWEEEDFSDDGARFYCYKAGSRVRVSKTTWNEEVFLAGTIHGHILDYDVYGKLPHYESLDRLNGVSIDSVTEEDLKQLYADCLEYEKEYIEAEKNVVFPTIKELSEQCVKIRAHYQEQLKKATEYIEKNAVKLLMNASEYRIKDIRNYLNTLSNKANGFDPNTYPQSIQKSAYGINFAKPTNRDLTESWYYDQIIDIIDNV